MPRWAAVTLLGALSMNAGAADTPSSTAAPRALMPDDIYRVQDVSDPRVSPEGQWVAYVLTTNDRDSDEARSAVWMVSWDGTQHVALTAAAEGTGKPRWSPDGRFLAFMATPPNSDKTQIMVLDRRGGNARQLTSVSGEISDYAWSPDGTRLVIVMDQGEEPGADKTPRPIVIEAFHFKDDEDGYLAAGHGRHLYLVDVATQQMQPLTLDPAHDEDAPVWSPDGLRIAFVSTREKGVDQDGRTDIDIIDARAGSSVRILVRPYAPNSQKLAWSRDGSLITYLQGTEPRFYAYMQDHLVVVPAAGGVPRALGAGLDRAITSYSFAQDSKSILITVEDDDAEYAARIDVATGSATSPIAAGPFVLTQLSTGAEHVAVLKSDDHALAEVYALEAGGLRKLTAHNDALLGGLKLGAVEAVRFRSKDGADVHGLLVKPIDYVAGRKYPTLLWIHGGPNGHDEHSLNIDGYEFEPQMFAARGFAVLRVNYRGGGGRGEAWARAIYRDWGHKEVLDLLAGVDYLVERGIADKERLAVGGWSYGGLLTDYMIASDPRFKVAISGAGSGNQLSTYGTDQYALQYNNELGPPWVDSKLWLKLSYPFFHADRIHTPTLFVGGEKDFNVPISGGEQMYQSLRTLGIPAQLVIYPGQHHVFTRPSFVKDLAQRMPAWVDRFISPTR